MWQGSRCDSFLLSIGQSGVRGLTLLPRGANSSIVTVQNYKHANINTRSLHNVVQAKCTLNIINTGLFNHTAIAGRDRIPSLSASTAEYVHETETRWRPLLYLIINHAAFITVCPFPGRIK